MTVLDEAVILNNGTLMPKLGISVTQNSDLSKALKLGYRLFDTSEKGAATLQAAVAKNGRSQLQQLFLQLHLPTVLENAKVVEAFIKRNLQQFNLGRLNLVLLPASGNTDEDLAKWQALEALHVQGRLRSIGLIDFHLKDLQTLLSQARVKPVIDQLTMADPDLAAFLRAHRIQWERPLIPVEDNQTVTKLATTKKVTPSQLVLKSYLQSGLVTLVEADANLEVDTKLDFKLSSNEQRQIINSFQ